MKRHRDSTYNLQAAGDKRKKECIKKKKKPNSWPNAKAAFFLETTTAPPVCAREIGLLHLVQTYLVVQEKGNLVKGALQAG